MAVEARHLNLFPPQLQGNSQMMSAIEGSVNAYNTAIGHGMPQLSGTTTEALLPMYSSPITDSILAMTAVKADSSLTYALPVSRKRPRDSIHPLLSFPNRQHQNHNNHCGSFTFLGEDISLQIQQQQLEIDRFITQHTKKIRMEIEEQRKRYVRRIISVVEEGIMKELRAKEEEIEKIGKLNWALEEKVRSLCMENQILRDLAQTNEATANALRSNLEQVLAQVRHEQHLQSRPGLEDANALMDDAQSCCGSNCCADEEYRQTEDKAVKDTCHDDGTSRSSSGNSRLCRNCGKEESCVLLLPCRHLCLCTVCGSSVHVCPVCKSNKNVSVHVNMSS